MTMRLRLPRPLTVLMVLAATVAATGFLPGAAVAATPFAGIDPAPFMLDPSDSFQRYGALITELDCST